MFNQVIIKVKKIIVFVILLLSFFLVVFQASSAELTKNNKENVIKVENSENKNNYKGFQTVFTRKKASYVLGETGTQLLLEAKKTKNQENFLLFLEDNILFSKEHRDNFFKKFIFFFYYASSIGFFAFFANWLAYFLKKIFNKKFASKGWSTKKINILAYVPSLLFVSFLGGFVIVLSLIYLQNFLKYGTFYQDEKVISQFFVKQVFDANNKIYTLNFLEKLAATSKQIAVVLETGKTPYLTAF